MQELYSIKSWNWGRIVEKLRLIIGISRRTISLRHICIKNRLPITTSWRLKKKTWPPDSFFFYSSPGPLSSPPRIGHAIGPAQRRSMNYLEPDPTLPVRTEALIFSREKNHPAGQFCRGRPIGKRHAKTGTPLVDTGADYREPVPRLLIRLPDRPIQWPDMTSNRSFFRSCCPIVEKDFSVAVFFFFLSFNELGSHVSAKSMLPCGKYPDISLW